MSLLIVKLDDTRYPGNGGIVIAHCRHVDALRDYEDRDGARDPSLRVWQGDAPIGSRVTIYEGTPEEAKAAFERWRANTNSL